MTDPLSERQRELLIRVLDGTWQGVEVSELDVAVLNDRNVAAAVRGGEGPDLLQVLDLVLDLAASNGNLRAVFDDAPMSSTWVPEGGDGRGWFAAMRERVAQLLAEPTVAPEAQRETTSGFLPPRTARWESGDPTPEVLDVLRPRLDSWMTEPASGTWFRHHHLVDLGRVVGHVAPVLHHSYGQEELWEQPVQTTVVSIGIRRDVVRSGRRRDEHDLATWSLVYARPELPLNEAVRQHFPDLCHLFGGYYGQPFDDEHGWPLWMTWEAMGRTGGQARDRLRDQLTELLTIRADDDLIATVGHLGSYCLPYFMRHWVDRLLWKLDALDWGAPPLPRDS